jgi:hypothetical protein
MGIAVKKKDAAVGSGRAFGVGILNVRRRPGLRGERGTECSWPSFVDERLKV